MQRHGCGAAGRREAGVMRGRAVRVQLRCGRVGKTVADAAGLCRSHCGAVGRREAGVMRGRAGRERGAVMISL